MIEFTYLENNDFKKYADNLFSILFDNMKKIAPTGNVKEEDFKLWFQTTNERIQNEKMHIIMIFQKELHEIIGYFQYSLKENVLMMEEIQIHESYQGKDNIFRNLYGFIFKHIKESIQRVEAYANKENKKSIGILGNLGLSIIGENKKGTSYHFMGTYSDLLNWYNRNSNE